MQKIYVFNYGFKDMNPLSLGQEACRADKCYTQIRNHTLIHYIRSGKGILEKNGKDLAEIEGLEPEPSLGNGGLGCLFPGSAAAQQQTQRQDCTDKLFHRCLPF